MAKEVKKEAEKLDKAEEAKKAVKAAPNVRPGARGAPVKGAPAEPTEEPKKEEKKKEKKSQKERPRSKKKHAKTQIWKLYSVKDGGVVRKNEPCPRCGPGTFLAKFQNRKYCGKCGWGLIQEK